MRIGLHALGIGAGAQRAVIDAVATTAEHHGFSTLWAGEHVVMVDSSSSRYPYTADGRIAVPAAADWLDPLICLSFAAAATSTIRIATGVLLLPEHNPVVVAKKAATLDVLSGGRFVLGVGVGGRPRSSPHSEFRSLDALPAPRSTSPPYALSGATTSRPSAATSSGSTPSGSTQSRWTGRQFPLSSVETATQRCGEWPVGVTAGTGSTSMAPARPPSASATCGHPATTPGATLPTCMWPLRCETQTPPTSRNSPKPASTSWSSSRNRRAVRRRQPRG
jgi:hypothetical protein